MLFVAVQRATGRDAEKKNVFSAERKIFLVRKKYSLGYRKRKTAVETKKMYLKKLPIALVLNFR